MNALSPFTSTTRSRRPAFTVLEPPSADTEATTADTNATWDASMDKYDAGVRASAPVEQP